MANPGRRGVLTTHRQLSPYAKEDLPPDQATNWSFSRPEYFNFATDIFDKWAKDNPHHVAMLWVSQDITSHRSLTFQYFSNRSQRLAFMLTKLGVKQGEVLIALLPRIPAWWEVALAALRCGIILAPAPTMITENDVQYRCNKSKATAFVGDETTVEKFQAVRSRCPSVKTVIQVGGLVPEDTVDYYNDLEIISPSVQFESPSLPWDHPAIIYFTSGTSGLAKMVIHNQVSYPLALSNTGKFWMQLEPGKLFWNTADQGWGKVAYSFFGAWNCGATLFVFDDRQPFSVHRLLNILNRFPITTLCAPPLVWSRLTLRDSKDYYRLYPPKSLEHCLAAGEALNSEAIRQWKQLSNLNIHDGYGQTETILLCGNFKDCPIRPGSMGKPAPGVPLNVIDVDGRECAPGEEGNIALEIRSPNEAESFFGIFDGYIDENGCVSRPEHQFNVNGKTKTWYLTGDKGKKDEAGYFWFVGRADDVINSAGYRIGPFEVESTLKLHPAVAESAVISSPDPKRGEVVKAFVVLTDKYSQRASTPQDLHALVNELQRFCKSNAAPYKYPRKIQFVDSDFLPKTTSGKIQRNLLRKMEWKDGRPRI